MKRTQIYIDESTYKFLRKEKEPLLKRHAMWAISKISGEDFVE